MWDLVFRYLFEVKADAAGFKPVRSGPDIFITGSDGKIVPYDITLVFKEYTHVKEGVTANLKSKLPVFGSAGKEIWYGGNTDYTMPTVQLCWDDIEQDFPDKKRVDHIYMDYYIGIKKRFLCLPIVDVDDDTANNIIASVLDKTNSLKPVTIKKRAYECSIDALGLSKANTTDIRDLSKVIDIMVDEKDIVHSSIISLKA